MMQGQLSRADLFTALIEADDQVQAVLIKELDLFYVPEKVIESVFKQTSKWQTNKPEVEDKIETRSPTAILTSRYWQLVKQIDLRDEKKEKSKKKTDFKKYVKKHNFRNPPSYPALTTLEDMRSRLFSRLNQYSSNNVHIDITAVINKLSRAELIFDLPKKPRQHKLDSLQIIDDRQIHLTPYWMDHVWVTKHIFDEYSTYQVNRAVIQDGEYTPKLITDDAELFDYQLPAPQSPILILSDLGRLTSNASNQFCKFNSTQKKYWQLLQQLKANVSPIVLLTPCHLEDYPHILRQNVQVISWESHTQALPHSSYHKVSEQSTYNLTASWIELLLTLISPSIRLEPQLLRSIRTGLNRHGYSIPTAVEGLLWQHSDVKEPHNIAATIDNQANKKRRRKFTDLEPKLQAFALKVIRQWRDGLPPEIWFEELLSIEAMLELSDLFIGEDLNSFNEDIIEACDFLQYILDHNKLQDKGNLAYRKWATRLEARISSAAVETGKGKRSLQTVFHQLSPNEVQSNSGHVIDPDLLDNTNLEIKNAWLCLYGNQFVLSKFDPDEFEIPRQNTSVICPIKYLNYQIKLTFWNGATRSIQLPSDDLTNKTYPRVRNKNPHDRDWLYKISSIEGTDDLPLKGLLTIKTDHTELILKAIEKPKWASEIGCDAGGLYADLQIPNEKEENLTQRFRWISAGEFMMGSREKDLSYHKVILTHGFWFADSCITNKIWRTIVKKDISKTGVTWDEAHDFIKKLDSILPNMDDGFCLQLPTEAQWEYAIRRSASNSNIVSRFSGDYDFHPLIAFLNPHYNVPDYKTKPTMNEWCADAWQENLGNTTVTNPLYKTGSLRVIRSIMLPWNGLGSLGSGHAFIQVYHRTNSHRIGAKNTYIDFRLVISNANNLSSIDDGRKKINEFF